MHTGHLKAQSYGMFSSWVENGAPKCMLAPSTPGTSMHEGTEGQQLDGQWRTCVYTDTTGLTSVLARTEALYAQQLNGH